MTKCFAIRLVRGEGGGRRSPIWAKHGVYVKAGAKSRGAENVKRREGTASAAQKVEEAMQHLPNPFDEMSIDEKKRLALFLCKRRLQVL